MIRIRIGIVAAFMVLLGALPERAQAQVIYSFGGEHVAKVLDLPSNEQTDIRTGANAGRHIDIGVYYKQFSLFFIPLWNWETRFVGYVGEGSTYLEIPEDQLRALAAVSGVEMPPEPSLPFWDAWGGKLVLGAVLLAFILVSIRSSRSKTTSDDAAG